MRRFISFAFILLSVVLLISCTPEPLPPEVTTAIPETEPEKIVKDIQFLGGDAVYNIIRPDKASDAVIDAAKELSTTLRAIDQNITFGTDWVKPGDEIPAYEIIVGCADREEVASLIAEVPYCGYIVKVSGEKLIVLAANDEYIDDAVAHVTGLIVDNKLILKEDYQHVEDFKEGGYPLADAMLGSRKITEYAVSSKNPDLSDKFRDMIGNEIGVLLPKADKEYTGPEIVIGSSAKAQFEPVEYYEYRIEASGENVHFFAYGEHEYGHSFKVFIDMLEAAPEHSLKLSDNINSYKLPTREEYIKDITKLYMCWDYIWEAPEWMLDYNDKKESLFGGKGSEKLYASAHRAELKFFPENSIEAVISTYYLGAAIAELDICATKDGVLVLMHDNTLTRTTNVADFMGKPGYPNSANVADWTYAQLMDLNLKEGGGGNGAKLTPFKIATFEEALSVCKDRLFIVPDKYANWQYVKSDDIMQDSRKLYLSDLMKKTGNFESVLISYGISSSSNYLNSRDAVKLQKLLKTETGVTPYILLRSTPERVAGNCQYFERDAEKNSYAIQINGDYRPTTGYEAPYRMYGNKIAFLAWTIGTGDGWNDYRENWETMYEKGLRVIMTNDLFNLAQYCAEIGNKVMAENNG